MSDEVDAIVVFMTAANGEEAARLADMLVGAHLAACVQILPEIESVYRWQGKVETATETLAIIKTTAAAYPELETVLAGLHPYEVPEIMALVPEKIVEPYRAWLIGQVR